jgi:hypothetical protein
MNYRFVTHGMSTLRFVGFRPQFGEPPESHIAFKFVKLSWKCSDQSVNLRGAQPVLHLLGWSSWVVQATGFAPEELLGV